jgi:hypothetical protein
VLGAHGDHAPAEATPLVQPILELIENRFHSGNGELQQLILTSFLRPLARRAGGADGLRAMLGPELAAAVNGAVG